MFMQEETRKSRKDKQCSDKSTYWIAKQKRWPVQYILEKTMNKEKKIKKKKKEEQKHWYE